MSEWKIERSKNKHDEKGKGLGSIAYRTAGENYGFFVRAKEEVIERYVLSGYYES